MVEQWCCAAFQGHYENAGKRTFSALMYRDSEGLPTFALQHRALEPEDRLPQSLAEPVSLVSEVQIQFCPWCGTRLNVRYKKLIDERDNGRFRLHLDDEL